MPEALQITRMLEHASGGDRQANDALFASIYPELRKIARANRRRWRGNETISTTVLINEAYLKLAGRLDDYDSRAHFFATASRAMRQVLINYAERFSACKRGGNPLRVTMPTDLALAGDTVESLLAVDDVLTRLEADNERQCRVVECRVFGGMSVEETAAALGISARTVKRDWALATAWLYRELQECATT